jgi:hypothetical protein
MKLDLVIHSSDSNPFYLDFWPLVSRVWKEGFGIEPILLYIDENHDIPIDETYGKVVKMKPVPGVPLYLQCQWIRYWYPSQVPELVCMLSDIDMFPISKRYFVDQIANIPDTKYVHINPFHEYLPCCYHIAKGSLFADVLKLEPTWEQSIRNLYAQNLGHDCFDGVNLILKDKPRWGSDEEHSNRLIRTYPDQSIFQFIGRTHKRIDRSHWVYAPFDIKADVYADSHSIRPYSQYKREIDSLVTTILDTLSSPS